MNDCVRKPFPQILCDVDGCNKTATYYGHNGRRDQGLRLWYWCSEHATIDRSWISKSQLIGTPILEFKL